MNILSGAAVRKIVAMRACSSSTLREARSSSSIRCCSVTSTRMPSCAIGTPCSSLRNVKRSSSQRSAPSLARMRYSACPRPVSAPMRDASSSRGTSSGYMTWSQRKSGAVSSSTV